MIEILSPSTSAFDQITKRDLYAKHGVGTYWLVHPVDRVLTVYRRAGDDAKAFGPAEVASAEGIFDVADFTGLTIDWNLVFPPKPPPKTPPPTP